MGITRLIADTHLKHKKVATYCDRPEGFTELIHKNVMQTQRPEDLLIHLGDVGIDKEEGPDGFMKYVREWPGRKWLIMGNHDNKSATWYMDHGFDMACHAMLFRGVWLTHHPALSLPYGAHLNVHGHLHNVWDGFYPDDPEAKDNEFVLSAKLGKLPMPFNRLFAVEYTDYRPVDFDKFVAKGHKLYQSAGPNEETRKKQRLLSENALKCSATVLDPEPPKCVPDWDRDTGNGFNERGYPAGLGIYHDPMG